ncbi:MAG: tetratricopeptide repeat protein [Magnetococcales bacterium]|nr:tetratricopeptide repeat protein [Magnetococcales bacterium]
MEESQQTSEQTPEQIVNGHFAQGTQHHTQGRIDEAIACYQQALTVDPRHVATLNNLSIAYMGQGKLDDAIVCYDRIIAIHPDVGGFRNGQGAIFAAQGKNDEAIACYRKALELKPDLFEAHDNLGRVLMLQGDIPGALVHFNRAVEIQPQSADLRYNLANGCWYGGQPEQAVEQFEQALKLNPAHALATHALVQALERLAPSYQAYNRLDEAIVSYRRLLELKPDHPEAPGRLASLLFKQGQLPEAAQWYQRALEHHPQSAELNFALGVVYSSLNQVDEAIAAYQRSIALNDRIAEAHHQLGSALSGKGRWAEAVAPLQRALELKPEMAESCNMLGICYALLQRFDEAVASYHQALQIRPNYMEVHNNLAHALTELGRWQEAVDSYRQALVMQPDSADVHFNLGNILLLLGQFREGWLEYEWRRFKDTAKHRQLREPFGDRRPWDGSDLQGKTILLLAEQGFGDVLQFARYIPMVAECGGRIVLACQPELYSLLQPLQGVAQVVKMAPSDWPEYDEYAPLLCLPRIFQTEMHSIPAQVPYLTVVPEQLEIWQKKMPAPPPAAEPPKKGGFLSTIFGRSDKSAQPPRPLRVGLVWAGSAEHGRDALRSIHQVELLLPLFDVPNVQFFNLQKGPASQGVQRLPADKLHNLAPQIFNFMDTGAILHHLDLLITVDSAPVHLAGALARPVWLLVPFIAEWRWLVDRDDSPWYPTLRLFRQRRQGDWGEVIERVAQALVVEQRRQDRT